MAHRRIRFDRPRGEEELMIFQDLDTPFFKGHQSIDRRGGLWKRCGDEFALVEGVPPLDPDHPIVDNCALTLEGKIYDLNKKTYVEIETTIRQFRISEVARMDIFALTQFNELIRIQLRGTSASYKVIQGEINHLINYDIKLENRRLKDITLDVVNHEGHWLILTLDRSMDKVAKVDDRGYMGEHVYHHRYNYLLTVDGSYLVVKARAGIALMKIKLPEDIIALVDVRIKGTTRWLMALDNRGNLFYDYRGDKRIHRGTFHPCQPDEIVKLNQGDQWVNLIPLNNDQIGLVSLSGKVYLINEEFKLTLINIPAEIYGKGPSKLKSARSAR